MTMQSFEMDVEGSACEAFVFRPEMEKPLPAVLFLMDAFGPRPQLFQMAEKIASQGHLVLLPNMFHRLRRIPVIEADFPLTNENMAPARSQLMELIKKYDPNTGVQDAEIFLDALERDALMQKGPVAVVGYCLGGGLALRIAARYGERIGRATLAEFISIPEFKCRLFGKVKDDHERSFRYWL